MALLAELSPVALLAELSPVALLADMSPVALLADLSPVAWLVCAASQRPVTWAMASLTRSAMPISPCTVRPALAILLSSACRPMWPYCSTRA